MSLAALSLMGVEMDSSQLSPAVVNFFNDQKGWGFVVLASGESAFVHKSVLPGAGYRTLFSDEPVCVRVEQGAKGLQVAELVAPEGRIHGVVREFDMQRGFGVIATVGGATYFAHFTNVLTRSGTKAELIIDEDVEFTARPRDARGPEAIRIKRLDARGPLERFTYISDFRWPELQLLAEDEDWEHASPDPDGQEIDQEADDTGTVARLPILRNYIRYTFARLQEEGKVAFGTRDGIELSAFNTGLVTASQEEIYGLVERYDEPVGGHEWKFVAWIKASDNRVSGVFSPRPAIATYWTDPSVLFFRPGLDVVLDFDHFIDDNIDRYPPMFRGNPELARMATVAAVDAAKRRVARNYKTAVPQYHRGEVQLLLPLSLDGSGSAQLALVARFVGTEYIGETVLPLRAALMNARLLAKPDRDWLNA